jgi:hypothetical protein
MVLTRIVRHSVSTATTTTSCSTGFDCSKVVAADYCGSIGTSLRNPAQQQYASQSAATAKQPVYVSTVWLSPAATATTTAAVKSESEPVKNQQYATPQQQPNQQQSNQQQQQQPADTVLARAQRVPLSFSSNNSPSSSSKSSQLLQKFPASSSLPPGGGTAAAASSSKLQQQRNQQATNTLPALSLRSPFHLLARHPQANIRLPWQAAKIENTMVRARAE